MNQPSAESDKLPAKTKIPRANRRSSRELRTLAYYAALGLISLGTLTATNHYIGAHENNKNKIKTQAKLQKAIKPQIVKIAKQAVLMSEQYPASKYPGLVTVTPRGGKEVAITVINTHAKNGQPTSDDVVEVAMDTFAGSKRPNPNSATYAKVHSWFRADDSKLNSNPGQGMGNEYVLMSPDSSNHTGYGDGWVATRTTFGDRGLSDGHAVRRYSNVLDSVPAVANVGYGKDGNDTYGPVGVAKDVSSSMQAELNGIADRIQYQAEYGKLQLK